MATRRQYSGNAPATVLQTGMTAGAPAAGGTINVSAGTGTNYPDGSVGPFFIVIDRGTANEEKVLISSRSTDTFTISARGADGTTAASHTSGTAVIEHSLTKTDLDEANAHVAVTSQDDHTQYLRTDGTRALTAVTAIANSTPTNSAVGDVAAIGAGNVLARSTHVHGREGPQGQTMTFTVAGNIAVPSGSIDYINPAFIHVATGRTVKLVAARYIIQSGTSATIKLQKGGVDITGFTGMVAGTTAASTTPTAVTLADNDMIALVVTAVSGSPVNLSCSLYLEHS